MSNVTIENEMKMLISNTEQHVTIWQILRNNYFIQPHCNRITKDYYFDYKNIFYQNNITLRVRKANKIFINYKEPFVYSSLLMSRYEYKEFLNVKKDELISTSTLLDNHFGNQILTRYFSDNKNNVTVSGVLVTKRIVFSIHSKTLNNIGDRIPYAVVFIDRVYDSDGNFLFEEMEFETIDGYYSPQTYIELEQLKNKFTQEGMKEGTISKYQRYIQIKLTNT